MLSSILLKCRHGSSSYLAGGGNQRLQQKLWQQYICVSSMSTTSTELMVGFIGLGEMGSRMATNLQKSGRNLMVNDINQEAIKIAEKNGAKKATVEEIAQNCNVIITMLPKPEHVISILGSAIPLVKPNTIIIDGSTVDLSTTKAMHDLSKAGKALMIDAPVSGGVVAAEAGTLTFMVGGEIEALNAAAPFLNEMGANVFHCGGPGAGTAVKLCNNLSLAIQMIGTSEALNLGQKLGVDPAKLTQVMAVSTGRCWSVDTYNPVPGVLENVPSSRNYSGGFACDLMLKDLGLAVSSARTVDASIPLGGHAKDLYQYMSESGNMGDKDFSGIFALLEKLKYNEPKTKS